MTDITAPIPMSNPRWEDELIAVCATAKKAGKQFRVVFDGSSRVIWLKPENQPPEAIKEVINQTAPPIFYLYRFFDDEGRLLYIGITISVLLRHLQHRTGSRWFDDSCRMTWEILAARTRTEAEALEDVAIKSERPLHNIRGIRDIA